MQELVHKLLTERGLTLATAESCTGGSIAARFTAMPGASAYFLCGVVSYSNASKHDILGVAPEVIARHGPFGHPACDLFADGAVATPHRTTAILKQCGSDRGQIIDRASAFAISLLRDELNGK